MHLTHLTLGNWRNFKSADLEVGQRLLILGPNASGKSNLLDALRFLRHIATPGGGFQDAVTSRGGLSRVRCLAARNYQGGKVETSIRLGDRDAPAAWSYRLQFGQETRGRRRPIIKEEVVELNGDVILQRPDDQDRADPERLTQTFLEQVNTNQDFRAIPEFLRSIRYLHLVPQILRTPQLHNRRADDPYGSDFLLRVARTSDARQHKLLNRISNALKAAVPQLDHLALVRDEEGRWHLEARYAHWRPQGARQNEQDFSDGTLRLIALLWSLLEGGRNAGPLLLEEPELSLNTSIVRQLPSIISRLAGAGGPQVLFSTHSEEILRDPGLGLDEAVVLIPDAEGTRALSAASVDGATELMEAGLSLAEIVGPRTRPERGDEIFDQLHLPGT